MGADIISTKPKRSTTKLVKDSTMAGLGNFIKLLPTGTVFLFHFLNPLLSNYGECGSRGNINMTKFLIAICGIISVLSCFTDSYFGIDGQLHYGIATATGIWPGKASGMSDLSQYKLRTQDFVLAIFSALVSCALIFTDHNIVDCFYNEHYRKYHLTKLTVVPAATGLISSIVFSIFPSKRHGIGYPSDEYPEIPEE